MRTLQTLVIARGSDTTQKLVSNAPMVLFVLGLVAFVVAGYLFTAVLGTVLLGVALIVLAYVVSPDQKVEVKRK